MEYNEKFSRAENFFKRDKSSKIEKSARIEKKSNSEKSTLGRGTHRHAERKKSVYSRKEMFDVSKIPYESKKILETFDDIVAEVRGLNAKQRVFLSSAIKKLSHELTDDRGSRRLGYMNNAESVSAYIAYFMWWNLVRLTRLFANLPKKSFNLSENSVAIDIGSGPLTVVIALWLARPELRSKKITWYCMDLSQTALSQGEELYLSIVAKTIALMKSSKNPEDVKNAEKIEAWKIIRVKGALGTEIKEKADLITCANAFNEIIQNNEMPTDFLAKKYSGEIEKYMMDSADSTKTVLLVEPGDPHSARFISLMRDAFIRRDFLPIAPCTHCEECPMAGRTGGKSTVNGKSAKWCNFGFDTEDAPAKLLKLSEKANLPKERAVLSFVLLQKKSEEERKADIEKQKRFEEKNTSSKRFRIRIASNFIKLPELHKSGYYACSELGLLLAVDMTNIHPKNGELLEIPLPQEKLEKDSKSGAKILKI